MIEGVLSHLYNEVKLVELESLFLIVEDVFSVMQLVRRASIVG